MAAKAARRNHGHLLATVSLVACTMVLSTRAETQPVYDRRIEEAAIRMLLPKLGDIRGSLDLKVEQHLFPPLSERATNSKSAEGPTQLLWKGERSSILRY